VTGSAGQLLAALRAGCAGGEGGARQEDCRDAGVLSPGCISAQVRNFCAPVLMLSTLSVLAEREELVKKIVVTREYCPQGAISSGEERLCACALRAVCASGEGGARQEDCRDAGVLSPGCISVQVRNVWAPEYCPQGAYQLR
jgi:hypothetical protein